MKFKEYLEKINALAKEHPESLDFDVVYATDDEGNGYCRGVFDPSLAAMEEGYHCDRLCDDEDEEESEAKNCVLIN